MSDSVTQVVDPVCGMTIDREKAVTIVHQGTTYYFCEAACAETFREDPERWINASEHDPMRHAH